MYKILALLLLLFPSFVYCQQNDANRSNLYRFEGTYDFGDRHHVTLGVFDELNHSLVYLDLNTLKVGALIQLSTNTFKDMSDSTILFSFSANQSGVSGLTIKNNRQVMSSNKIANHMRESISFKSGNHLLQGDLYLPDRKGLHPVVVFAHGSGPATRSVGFFTTFFLRLGIGVLTFDKQGAGESSGNWETASLDELSKDLLAGIDFLKTRKEVDVQKIGMMGNSQGGWVGSMAAAQSKEIAFLLMRVGSGENVFNTISHEYHGSLLADGYTSKEIDEIMEMYHSHWTAAMQGKTWEDGNDIISSFKNKLWFKKVFPHHRIKTSSSANWWIWLQKNLRYDPYTFLKEVETPTLWLLGEKDWNVNSKASLPRIKKSLTAARNKDFNIRIIPEMAHNGMVAKTGYYNEAVSFRYAKGFWERLEEWLKERGVALGQP